MISEITRQRMKNSYLLSDMERFVFNLDKISENGCWLWTGCKTQCGYGQFRLNGKQINASRASWILFKGMVPQGLSVLHKCDNPICANPNHLFLGTQSENVRDMIEKGRNRHAKGEENGMSKLKREQVIEIRILKQLGYSARYLARYFSINLTTIFRVCSRKIWKNI